MVLVNLHVQHCINLDAVGIVWSKKQPGTFFDQSQTTNSDLSLNIPISFQFCKNLCSL